MQRITPWFLCLLTLSTLSSATPPFRKTQNVTWGPCASGVPAPLECTTLQFPLDWKSPHKGLIPISIIRLPASIQPRQGFMFYNPGGPGGSGIQLVAQGGVGLQNQIGASWDVVSWDPRGVGESGPNITTFLNDAEYRQFWDQTQGLGHLDAHGNLTTQSDVDFFMSQAPIFDGMATTLNAIQLEKNGDNLTYIGTCAVVRDLVAMVDAIYGDTEDVNFWGYSYGTIIGTYLTQMFASRVGRVILDGVYDPVAYSNLVPIKWLDTDVTDTEAALTGWMRACVAAPGKCRVASRGNGTVEGLRQLFDDVIDYAYRNYDGTVWGFDDYFNSTKAAQLFANPNHISLPYIMDQVFGLLYSGRLWSVLDGFFDERAKLLPAKNSTNITTRSLNYDKRSEFLTDLWKRGRTLPYSVGGVSTITPEYARKMLPWTISCSDSINSQGETTEDLFRAIVSASQQVSHHFAPGLTRSSLRDFCHRMTSRAVERLPKSMDKKPKNIVLVIGNTADPITPFKSAQKIASKAHLGKKSRLVKFHAIGHTSSSNNSTCIDEVVRKYLNGNPPADSGNDDADVECQPDGSPFD